MVAYNNKPAVRGVSFDIGKNEITALIGPSGCGKSTLIRCLNRMNDLIPGATVDGEVLYHGQDLYAPEVDAVEVRKRIGMVFQKPNPFPKSIYDNIAFGPRVLGMKGNMDEIVERALTQAALWDEVKDRLKTNAFGMSGGQQQRLCIARCARSRARRDPDGRALLGARPDLDGQDRGPDDRAEGRLLDRDRHPQHAAGRPRLGQDGLLHGRAERGRAPHRARRRVRTTPRRSSRTRTTRARRRTSPARSVRRQGPRAGVHPNPVPGSARRAREAGHGRAADGRDGARARARDDSAPGRRAGEHGHRRRRSHRRPLPRGAPGRAVAARIAGARGRRPASRRGSASHHQAHRAHGRPVREHGEARAAGGPRAACGRGHPRADRAHGSAGSPAGDPVPARPSSGATSTWRATSSARTTRSTG